MSLNREAKCRKAESQQVKLENEEMGAWQEVPLLDTGSNRSYAADPATGSPTLRPGPLVGKLIAHKDAHGRTFYAIEGQGPPCMVGVFGKKEVTARMTETFLSEHLPLWEM